MPVEEWCGAENRLELDSCGTESDMRRRTRSGAGAHGMVFGQDDGSVSVGTCMQVGRGSTMAFEWWKPTQLSLHRDDIRDWSMLDDGRSSVASTRFEMYLFLERNVSIPY